MAVEHVSYVMEMALKSAQIESGRSISASTRKLVLLSMVWEIKKGTDYCFKSVKTIVRETRLSRRAVQAAIRSFEREGRLIPVDSIDGTPWRGVSNAYLVNLGLVRTGDAQAGEDQGAQPGHEGAASVRPPAQPGHVAYAASVRPIGITGINGKKDGSLQQAAKETNHPHVWAVMGDLRQCALCHLEEASDGT